MLGVVGQPCLRRILQHLVAKEAWQRLNLGSRRPGAPAAIVRLDSVRPCLPAARAVPVSRAREAAFFAIMLLWDVLGAGFARKRRRQVDPVRMHRQSGTDRQTETED